MDFLKDFKKLEKKKKSADIADLKDEPDKVIFNYGIRITPNGRKIK